MQPSMCPAAPQADCGFTITRQSAVRRSVDEHRCPNVALLRSGRLRLRTRIKLDWRRFKIDWKVARNGSVPKSFSRVRNSGRGVVIAMTIRTWPPARWLLASCLVALAIGGLLLLAIWVVPAALVGPSRSGLSDADRLRALNDVRSPLVTVVGGLLLFAGAAIGAVLTARTIRVNREGQLTERFSRAVDQLGSDKLDVCLGGIYALERIAQESPTDHGPIVEILSAYLREHAAWKADDKSVRRIARKTDEGGGPRADFQAAATVLGRRAAEHRRLERYRLDLANVDLRGANLFDVHWERAFLEGAHLEGADFGGAFLSDANLHDAHLDEAVLIDAHLDRAYLLGAHLRGANLRNASIGGAQVYEAELKKTNYREALGLPEVYPDESEFQMDDRLLPG